MAWPVYLILQCRRSESYQAQSNKCNLLNSKAPRRYTYSAIDAGVQSCRAVIQPQEHQLKSEPDYGEQKNERKLVENERGHSGYLGQ